MASTWGRHLRAFGVAVAGTAALCAASPAAAAAGRPDAPSAWPVLLGIGLFALLSMGGFLTFRLVRGAALNRNRLLDAAAGISDAFSLFDGHDRLVVWNDKLTDFFPSYGPLLREGTPFAALVRASAEQDEVADAEGRIENWIADRLGQHRQHIASTFRIPLTDGRILEVGERATREGGVVVTYSDITQRVRAESKLRRREADLERAQELAHLGNWVWLPGSGEMTWSRQLYAILGLEPDQVSPSPEALLERVHPADRDRVAAHFDLETNLQSQSALEHRVVRPDGTLCHVRSVREITPGGAGGGLVTGIVQDLTERRRTEEHLNTLIRAVEQSPTSVMITDAVGNIEYVNPTFSRVSGYSALEVIGRNPRFLKSGCTPEATYQDLWDTILAGREWRGEFHNRRKTGGLFWEEVSVSPIKDPDGAVTHFVAVKEDVSVRKDYEERLLRQANFDELTDLPNRVLAMDRLGQALARAAREKKIVAAMVVNLDNLKRINNSLGHAAGDAILVETGQRISGCLRTGDTVARLEGDQFLVILPDLSLAVFAEVVAQKVLEACAKTLRVEETEIAVTACIGLTVYPTDGADAPLLLRNAHAAVLRAKELGGNAYRFFTPNMNDGAVRRLHEETLLRKALERDELYLHFQPLLDAKTRKVVGAEALLRWHTKELGQIPPDQFIPSAEKSGLIVPIGEWVLMEACKAAKGWMDRTGLPVGMAVNVSFRQFQGGSLSEAVGRALEASGLPPELLELEVTERILMREAPETGAIINTLNDMGVKLSMDDFGTGYSSLSYLKRFPFDVIKVDQSFVQDIDEDPEDARLASAIISMGRSLGLKIVAEGVETQDQFEFLCEKGCDIIQGFYLSRPLMPDAFETYLLENNATTAPPPQA